MQGHRPWNRSWRAILLLRPLCTNRNLSRRAGSGCLVSHGCPYGAPRGSSQDAIEGCGAFEISATVFETRSGLSLSARSACETMPMMRSSASTIGSLRTWCSCIRRSQVSIFSPSRHVNGAELINFSILAVFGSKPLRDDRAAQIPAGNYPHEFARLLIGHRRHGTNVPITQDLGHCLSAVAQHTAGEISTHDF